MRRFIEDLARLGELATVRRPVDPRHQLAAVTKAVQKSGDKAVLFDPGNFSHGFEGITGLSAILITHQHPDHADVTRLPALIEANPQAALYADPQTARVGTSRRPIMIRSTRRRPIRARSCPLARIT